MPNGTFGYTASKTLDKSTTFKYADGYIKISMTDSAATTEETKNPAPVSSLSTAAVASKSAPNQIRDPFANIQNLKVPNPKIKIPSYEIHNITYKRSSENEQSEFRKTRYSDFSKPNQAGMTLIEVLVAMFVLAIGVLALLAIQLRTVSSVREAEGQTIVSQLTQNLVEGMLINPRLVECPTPKPGATNSRNGRGWCKNYSDYYTTYGDSSTEPLKKVR